MVDYLKTVPQFSRIELRLVRGAGQQSSYGQYHAARLIALKCEQIRAARPPDFDAADLPTSLTSDPRPLAPATPRRVSNNRIGRMLLSGKNSRRKIARVCGCSYHRVMKVAQRLGLDVNPDAPRCLRKKRRCTTCRRAFYVRGACPVCERERSELVALRRRRYFRWLDQQLNRIANNLGLQPGYIPTLEFGKS